MDFELSKSQKEIQKAAREFAKGEFDKELALELDRKHEFPRKIWQKAAELGFIGVHYPEAYSGQGLGVPGEHPDRRGVLRAGLGHRQRRHPGELCVRVRAALRQRGAEAEIPAAGGRGQNALRRRLHRARPRIGHHLAGHPRRAPRR
ncbi:MAG: acyl-CoA dehydrogenase family protein [Desulfobacterales bacterium]|nr:acyl-CoA dehydrogenase family protein [Desulfobacterales bacterium]